MVARVAVAAMMLVALHAVAFAGAAHAQLFNPRDDRYRALGLQRARAEWERATADWQRTRELRARGLASELGEIEPLTQLEQALAGLAPGPEPG